jgi:hypothetical protein
MDVKRGKKQWEAKLARMKPEPRRHALRAEELSKEAAWYQERAKQGSPKAATITKQANQERFKAGLIKKLMKE